MTSSVRHCVDTCVISELVISLNNKSNLIHFSCMLCVQFLLQTNIDAVLFHFFGFT